MLSAHQGREHVYSVTIAFLISNNMLTTTSSWKACHPGQNARWCQVFRPDGSGNNKIDRRYLNCFMLLRKPQTNNMSIIAPIIRPLDLASLLLIL